MAYVNNVGVSVRDSFMLNTTVPESRDKSVYLTAPRYNVVSQLADLFTKDLEQVSNRKHSFSKLGNLGVTVEIATRTADGNNLVLTFHDPEFQRVRERDIVECNGTQGRVISAAPGTITISPWADSSGANLSTFGSTFAQHTNLSVLFDASADSGSYNKQSLTYSPDTDYNYAGVVRDAVSMSRSDLMQSTYELVDGKFWQFKQEFLMMSRVAKQNENKFLRSVRNQKNGVTTTGGFIWAAKTYGTHKIQSTSEFTEDELCDVIDAIKAKSGRTINELLFYAGQKWIANFQRVIVRGYIQQVGTANTIGGAAVKGINGMEYSYNNVRIKIVECESFNDPETWGRQTSSITGFLKSMSSCLILSVDDVETMSGMKKPFEKFYLGPKPVHYFYQSGTIGVNALDPSKSLNMEYVLSSNDYDGFTAGVLIDDGIMHYAPEGYGFWELAS